MNPRNPHQSNHGRLFKLEIHVCIFIFQSCVHLLQPKFADLQLIKEEISNIRKKKVRPMRKDDRRLISKGKSRCEGCLGRIFRPRPTKQKRRWSRRWVDGSLADIGLHRGVCGESSHCGWVSVIQQSNTLCSIDARRVVLCPLLHLRSRETLNPSRPESHLLQFLSPLPIIGDMSSPPLCCFVLSLGSPTFNRVFDLKLLVSEFLLVFVLWVSTHYSFSCYLQFWLSCFLGVV